MNCEELLKRISVDPNVCFGRPSIRGAALTYAAGMTRERVIPIGVESA